MDIGNLIEEFNEWLAALPPEFAFLLALPFAVAVAGLLRYAGERTRTAPRRNREREHAHGAHRRWSRVH